MQKNNFNTGTEAYTKAGNRKVNSSIVVCGCGRSGTTILGKLIGSFADVEYLFDPPFVHTMIYYIDKIDPKAWAEIFESYLYSDFFLNALAGRNLNFNRNDDSCIFNTKSDVEIESRLKRSLGRTELEEIGEKKQIAFKVTDLVCVIKEITAIYPGSRIIAIYRNAADTISSIIEKKWFTDEAINISSPEPMNFRLIYKGKRIPFWVKSGDYDFWIQTTEENRAAYYFIATNEILLLNRDLAKIVFYDQLVQSPALTADFLMHYLNLRAGTATQKVIDSIAPRGKRKNVVPESILPEFRQRIEYIEKSFATLALEQ